MGAKSITIVRAVTADFFFDCRAAKVPSDERIRDVPWGVRNDAQDLTFQNFNVGGGTRYCRYSGVEFQYCKFSSFHR
jgi:hypothetical protein